MEMTMFLVPTVGPYMMRVMRLVKPSTTAFHCLITQSASVHYSGRLKLCTCAVCVRCAVRCAVRCGAVRT